MRKRSDALPEKAAEEQPAESPEKPGRELADRLREAGNVDEPLFGEVPDLKPIHARFSGVVSKVFVRPEDFEEAYDKLVEVLRALEGRNERAFQKDLLTRAAEGHRLAGRLYSTAQRDLSNWEADNGVVLATMRERANRELQAEKEQGKRNKTITDRDVDDRASMLYPDKYAVFVKRKREYELTVKDLESAMKSFDHLNNNLRSLVGSGS